MTSAQWPSVLPNMSQLLSFRAESPTQKTPHECIHRQLIERSTRRRTLLPLPISESTPISRVCQWIASDPMITVVYLSILRVYSFCRDFPSSSSLSPLTTPLLFSLQVRYVPLKPTRCHPVINESWTDTQTVDVDNLSCLNNLTTPVDALKLFTIVIDWRTYRPRIRSNWGDVP